MGPAQSLCSSQKLMPQTEQSSEIQYDGERFVIPDVMNFQKPATIMKIEQAARSFCHKNSISSFYAPVLTRVLAYKHQKLFMNIWSRLGEDNRESFLEDLNNIPHDTMDSLYHHFKFQRFQRSKKSIKNLTISQPQMINIEPWQGEKLRNLANQHIREHKTVVFMCAGSSSRFGGSDKFLLPINLFQRVTILDLLFYRLKRNLNKKLNIFVLVNCNEQNIQQIQSHIKKKEYYGFDQQNISCLVNTSLPIFNENGDYCVDEKMKIIKRVGGTIYCAQAIYNSNLYNRLKSSGVQYLCFSGAQNLLENPCDPLLLGKMIALKRKVAAKCSSPHLGDLMNRFCVGQDLRLKMIDCGQLDQISSNLIDKLPVALNSMIFEIETLKKMIQSYSSSLSLSHNFHIVKSTQLMFNFINNKLVRANCYNFQKDLRYLVACEEIPLLAKVKRSSSFAPICSKNKQYSFAQAIQYYQPSLEKELAQMIE